MDNQLLQKAFKAVQNGERYAFATIIGATKKGTPQKIGAKMIVLQDGTIWGTIGGGRYEKKAQNECLRAIKTGKNKIVTYDYFGEKGQSVCGGQIKVFIEPNAIPKHLIICGAGHIALPLSFHGKLLNYRTTIVDNRRELANKRRFPHVDKIIVGPHAKSLKKVSIDNDTFIMIVTQGNEFDYECLKAIVRSKAGYIGVISSKAKRIKFLKRLKKEGVQQKYLNRVIIPAGLDIGAKTPEEIAVSIISEIVRTNNAEHMNTDKFKSKAKKAI